MNVAYVMAATAGLFFLAGGSASAVNLVSTPRVAQTGTIMATGGGVVLLAALAIRQLLS